jgi:NADH-quinone oxidoreductase subunit G
MDLAPNLRGAELVGARRVGGDDATGGLEGLAGFDGLLLVLGDALSDAGPDFGAAAGCFAWLGTHDAPAGAHVVLPVTTHAEGEGTFTNHEGRVQRFWPALRAPGEARPAWHALSPVAAALEGEEAPEPALAAEAFLLLSGRIAAFAGLSFETLGTRGALVNDPVPLPGA